MATEVGTLFARVVVNDREFVSGMVRIDSIAQRTASNLLRSFQSLKIGLPAGIAASISGIATAAIAAAADLDTLKRSLVAVNGSAALAEQQLARLREIAKLPGIDFEGAVQGAVRLQAVGFAAAESERILKAFANAVALTGGGAEKLREVTVQLGQLAGKGKVMAQDLRPIIEAAPAVAQALKRAFGTVDSEAISKQLQKAGKDSKDFINTLLTELERIPQVTGGAREAFANLGVSLKLALAGVGDVLLSGLNPALDRITKRLDDVQRKIAENQDAVTRLKLSLETLGNTGSNALDSLLNALGRLTTATIVSEVINGISQSIAIAQDAAELFSTSFIAGIKSVTLALESSLQAALSIVGIQIDALDNDIKRLSGELPALFNRINAGFVNARNTLADIEESRRLLAKYGAAGLQPLDPNKLAGLEGIDTGRRPLVVPKGKPAPVGGGGGGAKKALTDAQQLAKSLADVNRELKWLGDASSKEYQLKFKLDAAREAKAELERVIELRKRLFETGFEKESSRLESLQQFNRSLQRQMLEGGPKLIAPNFDEIAESVKKSTDAFDDLNDSIARTIPKAEMTNELRLLAGDLADEFSALNSIEKQIIMTRAKNADETIRAAEATARLKQRSQELRDVIQSRKEKQIEDLKTAAEQKIFAAQERLDDFKARLGQGFDELITSLAEGGARWIDTAKNIGLTFFNTLASEMMLAATGGKYSSLGGLLGGLLGGIFSGFIGPKLPTGGGGVPTGSPFWNAEGGPVFAGHAYGVGERGRELFIPETNGRIISNSDMRAMTSGKTINVTINVPITAPTGTVTPKTRQQIATETAAALQYALGRNG